MACYSVRAGAPHRRRVPDKVEFTSMAHVSRQDHCLYGGNTKEKKKSILLQTGLKREHSIIGDKDSWQQLATHYTVHS